MGKKKGRRQFKPLNLEADNENTERSNVPEFPELNNPGKGNPKKAPCVSEEAACSSSFAAGEGSSDQPERVLSHDKKPFNSSSAIVSNLQQDTNTQNTNYQFPSQTSGDASTAKDDNQGSKNSNQPSITDSKAVDGVASGSKPTTSGIQVNKPAVSTTDTHIPFAIGRGRGRGRGRGAPIACRQGTVPSSNLQASTAKMTVTSTPDVGKSGTNVWANRMGADRVRSEPHSPCGSPAPEVAVQKVPVITETPIPIISTDVQRSPRPVDAIATQGCGDVVSVPCRMVTRLEESHTPNPCVPRGGFQIPTRVSQSAAGTKGRHTIVRTNHLSLNIQTLNTKTAVHYDVSVDPDKPKRLLRRALEEFRTKHFPDRYPAFDGRKNLYSATPLPFNHNLEFRDTIKVMDGERQKEKEFKIVLKYATRVDLTSLTTYMKSGTSLEAPQQAIQVLDIVLRCAPALWFVPVGRSYFTPPTGIVEPLGDGYEMWYGLFQSVNLGWQPFVNVDVVHKGFPQAQSILKAIKEVCDDSRNPLDINKGLSDIHLIKLKKFLIGLKVDYVLPNNPSSKRTYKVNNVALPPQQLHFELDSGEHISVEEYFSREKKVNLKYRNLPCLHVGSLKRQVPIYLPLEFCSITGGQVTQKKLNDKQTANMIRKAATSTMDRERKIKDALVRARFSSSPQVQEFGFRVTENFQEVRARVLDPPKLEYRNKEGLTPQRGIWQPKPFLNGKRLDKWVVLVLDDRIQDDVIAKFIAQFTSQGNKLGMAISQAQPMYRMQFRKMKTELEPYFRECYKNGYELVIIVVSEKGSEYAFIKQVAELTVGVLTQCVKSSTMVKRMDFATAQNILLKVNSKLNGINHTLHDVSRPKIFQKPIMIVGADVTHPSPDETKIPSVAAVCASHDPKAFQYNTQFRLQPSRMEIIQDLESIMRQHLLYFYHKTGQMKPLRILFYRDGVSEGQFQQVLDSELTAIRSACSKLERDYKPAITFLVVQKRHHTRLFPTKREDSDGRNCNVVPGTIVDTTITHPTERDFYLVSHTSIQGVIRPTKYHCLWDDNRLSEDELEEITYFLCHMFSRCTRSVSYPAPTYYAHLAAYRARVYLSGQNLETLSDERLHTQLLGDLQKKCPMYFI